MTSVPQESTAEEPRASDPTSTRKSSGGTLRHVLTLLSGSVAAQLVPLLLTPLLTRLFVPAAFGVFGVFLAVENMLALVVAGRFDLALMLASSDDEARDLAAAALSMSVLVGAVVAAGAAVTWLVWAPSLGVYLAILPGMLVLAGFCQTLSFWSSRRKHFRRVAAGQLVHMGGYTLSSAVIGALWLRDGRGMVVGYLIGQALAAVMFAVVSRADLVAIVRRMFSRGALTAARRHSRFPLVNGPHALVDGLRDSGVVLLVMTLFGPAVNGAYSFTMRVLRTPVSTVGSAVFQVVYQRAAEVNARGGDPAALTTRALRSLVAVTLPLYVIAFPFMPSLFVVVFGDQWREAGVYAQILMPWLYLNLVAGAVSCVPLLKGRQVEAFGIALADAVVRCAALVIGWRLGGIRIALAAMSVGGSAVTLSLIVWYLRLLSTPGRIETLSAAGPLAAEATDL